MYRSGDWQDVMQVCLNGHHITDYAASQPQWRQRFCQDCGAKTIEACQSCGMNIPGKSHVAGVLDLTTLSVPKYCINCGAAYPWQAAAIENLREILRESNLSSQDLQDVDKALPDVLRNTPKTESAALKLKRIMGKIVKPLYDVALKVVTDVASETAKKTLGLNSK